MTTDRNDRTQTELTADEQHLSKLLDEALRPEAFDASMRLDLSRRIAAATTPLLGTKRAADTFDGPVPDLDPETPVPITADAPAVIGRIRPAHWLGGLVAAGLAAAVLLMVFGPGSTTVTPPPGTEPGALAAVTVDEAALEAQLARVQAFAEVDSRSTAIDEALAVFAMDLDAADRETSWLEENEAYGDELTTWMDDYQWQDDLYF